MEMPREKLVNLLNACLDCLCDCFGARQIIGLGFDCDLTDEEIAQWIIDNPELIKELRKDYEEEEP